MSLDPSMTLETAVGQIAAALVRIEKEAVAANAGVAELKQDVSAMRKEFGRAIQNTDQIKNAQRIFLEGLKELKSGMLDLTDRLLKGAQPNGNGKAHHRRVARGSKNKGHRQGLEQALDRPEEP